MITIFHGDDTVLSRKSFLDEKKKYPESQTLDLKDKTQGINEFSSGNLFSQDKALFIENLFSQKSVSQNLIKSTLSRKNVNFYIWEEKELSKIELKLFKQPNVKLFKIPQSLFYFLDNTRPNSNQNVILFQKALKNAPEDQIFYMLVRQFRLLLAISDGLDSIDEVKRLAPWQMQKLSKQASLWSISELKKIYLKLYKLDVDTKIGESQSHAQSIDFLLLSL